MCWGKRERERKGEGEGDRTKDRTVDKRTEEKWKKKGNGKKEKKEEGKKGRREEGKKGRREEGKKKEKGKARSLPGSRQAYKLVTTNLRWSCLHESIFTLSSDRSMFEIRIRDEFKSVELAESVVTALPPSAA